MTTAIKTNEQKRKGQIYWNVPPWAPTEGKYREMSTPIYRWLKELIIQHRQMMLGDDKSIRRSLTADEDLMNLCILVNKLRIVNRDLCNKKVIIEQTKEYDMSAWDEDLQRRMEAITEIKNKTQKVCKDRSKSTIGHVSVWKKDMKVSKKCNMISAFYNRLASFHAKRTKIDFSSPHLIAYNLSISPLRMEVDEICCSFLCQFLPEVR